MHETEPKKPGRILEIFVFPALLFTLALLANRLSLSCFFFADDFLCLDYLYRAFHGDAGIFLERMVSPWQEASNSLFYRPLCDLSLFLDYAVWAGKAFGYHLSNLLLNSLAVLSLYIFLIELSKKVFGEARAVFALLSAMIFAVYPMHVEPLVWICGRADLLACLFIILSLYFLVSGKGGARASSIASSLFYLLALLSKESAATGLVLFLLYKMLLDRRKNSFLNILKEMLPYFLTGLAYFIIRYLVLGTFFGGYSASLAEEFSSRFFEHPIDFDSLALLSFGTNLAIFSPDSWEVLALRGTFIGLGCLLMARIPLLPWDEKTGRLLSFFLLSALFILLPAAAVVGVGGALSNSRVFYLASAFYIPLIVASVYPLASCEGAREKLPGYYCRIISSVLLSFICLIFSIVCFKDFYPWLSASQVLLSIQKEADALLKALPEKRKLVLVIPVTDLNGAHLLIEFDELKNLLGPVFFNQDHSRLLVLNEFPDFNSSVERMQRILGDPEHYDLRYFNRKTGHFESLPAAGEEGSLPDIETKKIEAPSDNERAYLIKFSRDFTFAENAVIDFDLDWHSYGGQKVFMGAFFNSKDYPKESELVSLVKAQPGLKRVRYSVLIFDLRPLVGTAPCRTLYLRMPKEAELLSISLEKGSSLASLSVDPSSVTELSNGNYACRDSQPASLILDVSGVPGASSMLLETALDNYIFHMGKANLRSPDAYKHLKQIRKFNSTRTQVAVPPAELTPGKRHAFRLIAIDKNGAMTGYYSDTVCIDLRPNKE
ncbi:MAG: glucosyltransferase domain-containing protein [Candidatus Obscuribacterales bacterium]|nr:glucosyltransferase domain-containing protein [Candidatus Obscuribacterales bacterium]